MMSGGAIDIDEFENAAEDDFQARNDTERIVLVEEHHDPLGVVSRLEVVLSGVLELVDIDRTTRHHRLLAPWLHSCLESYLSVSASNSQIPGLGRRAPTE
jgi:hypothetical protein